MIFDCFLTALLLLTLAAALLYGARQHPEGNPHFFDLNNSKAMRGFWSIVVVLVHIPVGYRNLIQDMAGSFAYIGVTFFFLSSAYGLTLQQLRRPGSMDCFWRKRLPRLLLPHLIANAITLSFYTLWGTSRVNRLQFSLNTLFSVSGWVRLLLGCYFFFWVSHLLLKDGKKATLLSYFMVAAVSLISYILEKQRMITAVIWPTEIWGFVWGSLLAFGLTRFRSACTRHWLGKTLLFCAASAVLGLMYLKLKWVVFWGDYLLKILLCAAITLFILLLNSRISLGNRAILFLGDISYEIYLIHPGVLYAVKKLLPGASSGVFIWITVVSTGALAYLIHRISGVLLKRLQRPPLCRTR